MTLGCFLSPQKMFGIETTILKNHENNKKNPIKINENNFSLKHANESIGLIRG